MERLRASELILHAGDISTGSVLDELSQLGPPLIAVHGNVDDAALRRQLPERRIVELDGTRIGMVHDAGPRTGRLRRLCGAFPDCDAVVFGHSHIPLLEAGEDGFQIFNPGSPTDRRRQPVPTMGEATIDRAGVRFAIIALC